MLLELVYRYVQAVSRVACGMCFSLILQPETVLDFGFREIVGVFKLNVDSCRTLLD